jgi:hypothetical protein
VRPVRQIYSQFESQKDKEITEMRKRLKNVHKTAKEQIYRVLKRGESRMKAEKSYGRVY